MNEEPSLLWTWTIALLIFLVVGSIVALCIASMRYWRGYWKLLAGAPLAVLVIWSGIIVLSILIDQESHRMWPFEMFAWSMATAVYMMLLMTAKKTFDKSDEENRAPDDS